MGDNLFQGLPPPSAPPPRPSVEQQSSKITTAAAKESLPKPPIPALKSALKRSKPSESQPQVTVPEKRLRFKTTTDASETQVIGAMQKISSHIKNPAKFGKASKLAIQLIQADSVKPGVSDYFFAILESAMLSTTACNDASVRVDYHALFSAAQDAVECFNKKQRNQLTTWMIRAVVANDLFTDDSFVFSKATGRIKEAILNLPVATKDEDMEEAAALQDKMEVAVVDSQIKPDASTSEGNDKDESDPFGLDALIPRTLKKDEKTKGNKEATTKIKEEEEDSKRFLKSQREALILCLDIAARRYKTPWCQTGIDILVKHAFDNISRFTTKQRDAIRKLWASIREQQTWRKQGKSVSGKLDVNGFEWLQQKYANEKISIRHSVGGSGDRRAQQWLG
ncbi:hypothetical protein ACSBR1_027614 [Camellia fascicularis]